MKHERVKEIMRSAYRYAAVYMIVQGLILAVITGCSKLPPAPASTNHAIYKSTKHEPNFESGVFQAGNGGLIITNVYSSVSQNSLSFPVLSTTISGSLCPTADFNLSAGSTATLGDLVNVQPFSNLQFLCIWGDSLDLTVSCGTVSNTFGTTAGTWSVFCTQPYEWDISKGTGTLKVSGSWSTLSITAGTSASITGGTAATTNVHLRSSLTQ